MERPTFSDCVAAMVDAQHNGNVWRTDGGTASTPAVRSVESAEVENLAFVGDPRATARTAAP
jgi:hypothetical protein